MNPALFVKRYDNPEACAAAAAHHAWLTSLNSGVRIPGLHKQGRHHLIFERLPGHTPEITDLPRVAAALGRLHAAAYRRELRTARLDQNHVAPAGLAIPDFVSPRRRALYHAAAVTGVGSWVIDDVLDRPGAPAAFYKDPNVRNYLVNDEGVAVVDFDDLTLAPFGYDLAGLLVTSAMTYGRLDEHTVARCIDVYHAETAPNSCSLDDLHRYAELHHLLTLPYLGRNGYQHPWPSIRPWPDPFASAQPDPSKEPRRWHPPPNSSSPAMVKPPATPPESSAASTAAPD